MRRSIRQRTINGSSRVQLHIVLYAVESDKETAACLGLATPLVFSQNWKKGHTVNRRCIDGTVGGGNGLYN